MMRTMVYHNLFYSEIFEFNMYKINDLWRRFDDAKKEIVKNLLNENMDLNLISKVTGLTREEIENLKE